MKDLKVSLLLDFYGGILTDKQLDALELYYNEDLSLAEIAQHTKITRQGVRDSIKRGEAILFEMEEKLGFYEKISRYRAKGKRSFKSYGKYPGYQFAALPLG